MTAADTFFLASVSKKKMTVENLRTEMLAATVKYLKPLNLTRTTHPRSGGQNGEWISFADVPVEAEAEEKKTDEGKGDPP